MTILEAESDLQADIQAMWEDLQRSIPQEEGVPEWVVDLFVQAKCKEYGYRPPTWTQVGPQYFDEIEESWRTAGIYIYRDDNDRSAIFVREDCPLRILLHELAHHFNHLDTPGSNGRHNQAWQNWYDKLQREEGLEVYPPYPEPPGR